MGNTIDRENAVLASFLYSDDMGTDKTQAFILDSDIFTSSYRRATANKINEETNNDKMYGYLSVTLQDLTIGTAFENEWTDIIGYTGQTPMPFSVSKRYYDDLKVEYKKRLAGRFR